MERADRVVKENKHMIIIDRFEGEHVVLEIDTDHVNIPISNLPKGAKEGDVLRFIIDSNETQNRKQRVEDKMNRLFKES